MTFHATIAQKKLEEAGFDARQAFGIASVLETDVVRHLEETLVTRDHLDTRMAQLESKLDSRFAQIDSRFAQIDSRFAQIDSKFAHVESRFAQTDSKIAGLEAKLADTKTDMLKWMIGLTVGSTLTIVLTLIRFLK